MTAQDNSGGIGISMESDPPDGRSVAAYGGSVGSRFRRERHAPAVAIDRAFDQRAGSGGRIVALGIEKFAIAAAMPVARVILVEKRCLRAFSRGGAAGVDHNAQNASAGQTKATRENAPPHRVRWFFVHDRNLRT